MKFFGEKSKKIRLKEMESVKVKVKKRGKQMANEEERIDEKEHSSRKCMR